LAAAQHALQGGIGEFQVSLSAPALPGGQVTATVSWKVPNFFDGLLRLFCSGPSPDISSQTVAVFSREWAPDG